MTDAPLFAQLGYSKELYDIRQKNGNWLLFIAWCVEIAAAAIGFAIAGITVWQALEGRPMQDNSSDIALWGTALVGGPPFAMCGIVELCKIPIATLVYHSESLFWKLIFFAAMVLLSIVTFETMAAGMQQSYQLRTGGIQILAQKITQKKQALENLSNDLTAREAKKKDRASFTERRNEANRAASDRREEINSDKDKRDNSARETFGDSKSDSTRKSLDRLRVDRDREANRYAADLDALRIESKEKNEAINTSYQDRIDNIAEKRRIASTDLERKLAECETRTFGTRDCVSTANADQKDTGDALNQEEKDAQKERLEGLSQNEAIKAQGKAALQQQHTNSSTTVISSIERLSAELAKSSSTDKDGLARMLQDNEQKRQAGIAEVDRELEQNLQSIQQEETDYLAESAPENLNAIRAEMREISSLSETLKVQFDAETSQNQTYQIAKLAKSMCLFVTDRASCQSADQDIRMADIPSSYVDKVAMWWFGSLALIISTTGVLLAFGAMVLKYEHISQRSTTRGITGMLTVLMSQIARIWNATFAFLDLFFRSILKLTKSLRKLVIAKRIAALKEPRVIEITKEVPVEKIVIKEIEVIKEVPVEKIVTKEVEVIKEVPVEKIVTREVEVVKEVPVEKIVIKEIEKKVPVKSKEFVYVPFYTDDPEERDKLNEKIQAVRDEINRGS